MSLTREHGSCYFLLQSSFAGIVPLASGLKHDSSPLLGPGRHFLMLHEIEELSVTPFRSSISRARLFLQLEELVQRTLRLAIRADLMIDGSFLTEKIDPDDIDVAIHVHNDFVESCSAGQKEFLTQVIEDNYMIGLDIFVEVEYPRHHDEYGDWKLEKSWGEQWGIEHSKKWCKGVAILSLMENHVGLRIRR